MFQESYMRKILAVVGLMAIVALGAYTYSAVKVAQYSYTGPVTISVTGKGEVYALPNIATFDFMINAKEADATTAQNKASETMKEILAYLKEKGVEEKDIKTSMYNLNPRYEYPEIMCTQRGYCPPQMGEPTLIGYEVSQSVTVKVRDTAKIGEIISGVGEKGAQNVSTPSFTIDDQDIFKAQAREIAIKDAKAKADVLAKNLGTRIVRMRGYWEEEGGARPYYGMGGDTMMAKAEMADVALPAQLPIGENTITAVVTISYEIR